MEANLNITGFRINSAGELQSVNVDNKSYFTLSSIPEDKISKVNCVRLFEADNQGQEITSIEYVDSEANYVFYNDYNNTYTLADFPADGVKSSNATYTVGQDMCSNTVFNVKIDDDASDLNYGFVQLKGYYE